MKRKLTPVPRQELARALIGGLTRRARPGDSKPRHAARGQDHRDAGGGAERGQGVGERARRRCRSARTGIWPWGAASFASPSAGSRASAGRATVAPKAV